jgi:hypothetical protein
MVVIAILNEEHCALNCDLRPFKTWGDETPYYKDYDRANDCADEARTLASLIPPDCLAKVCCNERSHNPEHSGQDKALRLILVARMKESRDHACYKPNYDRPNNAHCILPIGERLLCACGA